MLIATFRREQLTAVERIHWHARDRCPMPDESIDPKTYLGAEHDDW